MKLIFITSSILFILISTSIKLHVHQVSSKLQDQSGRNIVIHGVNVVYKQFPFLPSRGEFNTNDSLVEKDFINLKNWGFNSIRLFIAWQGFQPQQGQYNYTYLQQLQKIIREAKKNSISILLDAHQDLFSRKYCGQGFPTWLGKVTTFPFPYKISLQYDSNGFPTKKSCLQLPFAKYYLTQDVINFSYQFFTNKNGINDKFITMWEKVVQFFIQEDNVIGYDVINQPSGAKSIYEFIGPGMNNNKYLLPFYRKVAKAIRKIDQTKLLFFQPSFADQIAGFYDSPSQEKYKNLDVLSYHTYCPFQKSLGSSKCNLLNTQYITKRQKNAKQLRIGAVMSQFGSVSDQKNDLVQLHNIMNMTQPYLTSWYYWQFKYNADSTCTTTPSWAFSFYTNTGQLQYQKVKLLSHPYAYALCGDQISQHYSDDLYQLSITPKKCYSNKQQRYTEIFINQRMYFEKGFQVEFIPKCPECEISAVNGQRDYYQVIFSEDKFYKPMKVRVVGYIEE